MNFIHVILYVPNFLALVEYLDEHHPELLARDEKGALASPPIVIGFARTPAVTQGDELMIYASLTEGEAEQWRGMDGVQVLAEREFTGEGTADALFKSVRDDPHTNEIYERVYPRPIRQIRMEDGAIVESQRPGNFGMIAGA